MTVIDARTDLWRSLVGRGPDQPTPAEPGLWQAVVDRLNPAKARPKLRAGVEEVAHTSDRGGTYVMLASPERLAAYVRLAPEEVELAHLMDGHRTVAQLVGEFARATGRLAPDQVTRVVADLAGARMLDELPVDAFAPLVGSAAPPLAAAGGARDAGLRVRPAGGAGQPRPAGRLRLPGRRPAPVHAGRRRGDGRSCRSGASGCSRARGPAGRSRPRWPAGPTRGAPSSCWPSTWWGCSCTRPATRWASSTPAAGRPRWGSCATSGSRPPTSTPPTCGWPTAAGGSSPRPPARASPSPSPASCRSSPCGNRPSRRSPSRSGSRGTSTRCST